MNTSQLFDNDKLKVKNLLPFDGIVELTTNFISSSEADEYFNILQRDLLWVKDEYHFSGKHIKTDRMVSWYGDKEKVEPTLRHKKIHPWHPTLLSILTHV